MLLLNHMQNMLRCRTGKGIGRKDVVRMTIVFMTAGHKNCMLYTLYSKEVLESKKKSRSTLAVYHVSSDSLVMASEYTFDPKIKAHMLSSDCRRKAHLVSI